MRRPIHILSIMPTMGVGGDEHRLLAFARTFDRSRFELTIAVLAELPAGNAPEFSLAPEFEKTGLRIVDLAVGDPGTDVASKARRVVSQLRRLQALIRSEKVDVVDARLSGGAERGTPVAALTGCPSVVTTYNARPWVTQPGWWTRQQIAFHLASAIVTDSQRSADEISRFMIWPRNRVSVIPNGVVPPMPTRPARDVAAELGIPELPGTRVLGQISRMVPYKGFATLLEAARIVLDQAPHAYFLLIGASNGDDGHAAWLRSRAAELGIADRVYIGQYPGAIGDVWQLIDIHVHATTFDSLPNALLEAMSHGKPSISTRVGGIPEAIAEGESGLLVEPRDPQGLATAISRLLRDPQLTSDLGRNAHARYEREYQLTTMSRRLEQLFERLVGR